MRSSRERAGLHGMTRRVYDADHTGFGPAQLVDTLARFRARPGHRGVLDQVWRVDAKRPPPRQTLAGDARMGDELPPEPYCFERVTQCVTGSAWGDSQSG